MKLHAYENQGVRYNAVPEHACRSCREPGAAPLCAGCHDRLTKTAFKDYQPEETA